MPENDKIFQYWLTELRQRESSTITVVAITSAVSIIMLALFLQPVLIGQPIEQDWGSLLAIGAGLTFGIIGLSYREISKKIDDIQMKHLEGLMTAKENQMKNAFKAHAEVLHNRIRKAGLTLLTIIPIIAWSIVCYYEILLKVDRWIEFFNRYIEFFQSMMI